MSLFDKQIEPILLYGCPLWGMPSSNCTIKIRGGDIKDGRLRETLQSLFASLGSDGLDIISCRFHKKEEVAFVTSGNILDKITLFSQYYKSPTTITMEEVEKHADPITERFYSTSCKYALGISKYSSTTLAPGELGRFPLQHRIILLTLMYWLRLEQGTKNPLLNIAYLTMKKENHQWRRDIEYFLWKIGYGNIWLSPEKLSKDRLKLSLKRRLQDLHIQSFQNFLKEDENLRKCTIVNICTKETYSTSDYLSHINSPRIRSIFTKLRTDSNCCKDSSCRRYRGKKSYTDLCPHYNVTQDVQHIILACDHPAVKAKRENFLARYAKYVKSFDVDTSRNKLRELLNLDPSCAD